MRASHWHPAWRKSCRLPSTDRRPMGCSIWVHRAWRASFLPPSSSGESWLGGSFKRSVTWAKCRLGSGNASNRPRRKSCRHWCFPHRPCAGLEYLSAALLRRLWRELRSWSWIRRGGIRKGPRPICAASVRCGTCWAASRFTWPKTNAIRGRPFAFLATYTHRMSAGARLQHLPLAQALKEYAGAKNQAKLAALLEPVRQRGGPMRAGPRTARHQGPLPAAGVDDPQAYRFLIDVPRLEASRPGGPRARLVERTRPPRPQVQVRIGQTAGGRIGAWTACSISRSTWRSTASR